MMDAAARAELEALRRRAYDRDADIAGDEAAWERLAELEGLALADRSAAAPALSSTAEAPEPEASDEGPTADGSAGDRPSPRRLRMVALVASVTLVAAALGAVYGLQTMPDPSSAGAATAPSPTRLAPIALPVNGRVTIPLLVNGVRGEFVDVSWRADGPAFPASGVTRWAHPLGVYDGWALWVARVSGRLGLQNCLLLTDGAETEAQCLPHDATAERPVGVSLAFDRLGEDQRVTFEWGGGAYMTMEITDG